MPTFGPKISADKRLKPGTKVIVNRPSHPSHGRTGSVVSHGPTHVTVQHEDGTRNDHPVSVIHHTSDHAAPTYESKGS